MSLPTRNWVRWSWKKLHIASNSVDVGKRSTVYSVPIASNFHTVSKVARRLITNNVPQLMWVKDQLRYKGWCPYSI